MAKRKTTAQLPTPDLRASAPPRETLPAELPDADLPAAEGEAAGEPTVSRKVFVDVAASLCPKCGSARRERYHHIRRIPAEGFCSDGRPYSAIVLRYTTCSDCGQVRIDRTFE
jgi:predicted RNA-binding Zn-ribbon protein involved in translation (DUF1610 family)